MAPEEIAQKRQKEKDLISLMIRFYCEKYHRTKAHEPLCDECAELEKYAHTRVDRCPHIETKTFCSKCKSHCYSKELRARVKRGHEIHRTSTAPTPSNSCNQARASVTQS